MLHDINLVLGRGKLVYVGFKRECFGYDHIECVIVSLTDNQCFATPEQNFMNMLKFGGNIIKYNSSTIL